jgi:hypothetical protein
VLSFVLAPGARASRQARWTPLPGNAALDADALEVAGAKGAGPVNLVKVGTAWFVKYGDKNYPAKAGRIDDLVAALSKQGLYPVRSKSPALYAKFGVDDKGAGRIVVKRGGTAIFTLFVGNADATGSEIFVRRAGEDAVRAGPDEFSAFTDGGRSSWADLRLFPDHDKNKLTVAGVQRVTITPPAGGTPATPAPANNAAGAPPPPPSPVKAAASYTLVRDKTGWKFDGGSEKVDASTVESAVRFMLDATAEDFATGVSADNAAFSAPGAGTIRLETGDGKTHVITLGPKQGDRFTAKVSDSSFVFSLADWTVSRLWRAKGDYVEAAGGK